MPRPAHRLSVPTFRHPQVRPPWSTPAALIVAALGTAVAAFLAGIVAMFLQSALVTAWDVDMSYAPMPALQVLGTVSLYLLVFALTIPIDLIIFLPFYLTALAYGRGGWLAAACVGAIAGTLRFLPFEEPTWAGALGGLILGGVFGYVYHVAARWIGRG